MNKKYDLIYHVSDTDMDGYASQYLTNLIFENIKFYNPKRNELGEAFNLIIQDIIRNKSKKILLLITDFSLTEEYTKKLNNFKRGNKNIDIEYQLLDHHKTGIKQSTENEWYLFDNNKCATLLTSYYLIENFLKKENQKLKNQIKFIGEFVDAYDRWQKLDKYFEKANFINTLISEVKIPEVLKNKTKIKREEIFNILEYYALKFQNPNITIEDIEFEKPRLEKEKLEKKDKTNFMKDKNISLFKKRCKYFANEYLKEEKEHQTIYIDNIPFKVLYNVTGDLFQQMSSYILEESKEAKAIISIGLNGRCSLRSRTPEANVRIIAEKNFNGGGHDEAAGGEFKEVFETNSEEEVIKILKKRFEKEKQKKKKTP